MNLILVSFFFANFANFFWRIITFHNYYNSPEGGIGVVSRETMIQDICILKQHNFNSVRTSHYPGIVAFESQMYTHLLSQIILCGMHCVISMEYIS